MAVVQADLPAEFSATDATIAAFWIATATSEVDAVRWTGCGLDPDQGITLLASHYLKEAGEGAATKTGESVVRGDRVGEVSTTYSVETLVASAGSPARHPSTAYGRAYDQLYMRVERCRNTKPAVFFAKTNRTYT